MGICSSKKIPPANLPPLTVVDGKVTLTDEEWKKRLTPKQYEVARKNGTEKPFSGEYCDNKESGTYTCVCCGAKLFSSSTKYESGSGWPSFFQALEDSSVNVKKDLSHGTSRDAIECARCGAHLGHVFDDGPIPTGKRYCTNSAALGFEP